MPSRPKPTHDPRWRRYEKEVTRILGAMDQGVTVKHDVGIHGNLSETTRQIDVAIFGAMAGQLIKVVGECKYYRKKRVNVTEVEAFIGKILDVGADRGVIYSFSGFTSVALSRAQGARSPAVGLVSLVSNMDEPMPPRHPSSPTGDTAITTLEGRWFTESYREFLEKNVFLYKEAM